MGALPRIAPRMSRFLQGFPLLALLASVPAWADDAGMRRCRELADPGARLACYDALPLAKTPAPAAPAPTGPARAAPAAPAPVPLVAPAQPPTLTPEAREARFGIEQKAAAKEELPEIQSHIPGLFEGWRPNMRIRLANGQVWQIADDSSRMMERRDPKVTVRRALLGAFFLDFEGDNRSPRVRRVQ